ncbi:MAG: DsbA family protein [Alphaproteobacteria bacterium]|nr:DsbA family protein [Alphaproteobacteria bacterium]
MKKITLIVVSTVSICFSSPVFADTPTNTQPPSAVAAVSNFTAAQVAEIEALISKYIMGNPKVVSESLQAAMALKQQEEMAKMEKIVVANKDKIFKNEADPVGGNLKGTETLVVFTDPNCHYCKKFHPELASLLNTNKNVKIIFKDLPVMGNNSLLAIKAMLAAKNQGKYSEVQDAVYSADKPLTKKQIMKLAEKLGIDMKKFEADMKSKEIQAQIDQNLELSKTLGINGTPTLILGVSTVVPGYLSADALNEKLKEVGTEKK